MAGSDVGLPRGLPSGPPPPPPGIEAPDYHHDIARDIGQQVEVMILDAKHASENRVGKEIQKIKQKMEAMAEKIKLINDKAHNHNADLLKHHKDAIDQVQSRMTDVPPNPELDQVHLQLLQVDKVLQREMAKEVQMDQLMNRLTVVQQQLFQSWGAPPTASALMAPRIASDRSERRACGRGRAQSALAAVRAPMVATGKKAPKKASAKAPKGAKAAPGLASLTAASLRAEAPEFVPTGWE
eukprot:g16837.t1